MFYFPHRLISTVVTTLRYQISLWLFLTSVRCGVSSMNCPVLLVRDKALIMWFPGSEHWGFSPHTWGSKSENLVFHAAIEARFSKY